MDSSACVSVDVQRPSEITAAERTEMLRLMHRYYANVRDAAFVHDLESKDCALILRETASHRIVGFSTQVVLNRKTSSDAGPVLFSGDTIVDRDYWNSPLLARAWGRFALTLIDQYPHHTLYWLLLSKGYRTYRFLPLFFREYYPRPEAKIPEALHGLRDRLLVERYGAAVDARAGIVRGTLIDNYHVRPGVGDLTDGRLRDTHVRFFAQANPGSAAGDELCCIAPLTRDNFTAAARRVIGREYFGRKARSQDDRCVTTPAHGLAWQSERLDGA